MVTRLVRRISTLWRGRALDRELDAELRFHVDMSTEANVRRGLDPASARRAALVAFGGVEKTKDACRDERASAWLDDAVQDLRVGTRLLAKHRTYAVLAILTLALGIGANTAIFSVIHGVLLRPLPYTHGDRLVLVKQAQPGAGKADIGVSIAELFDYRHQLTAFDGLVEFHQMTFDLLNQGEPDRVSVGVVSPNFFRTLGVVPVAGRDFADADDDHGAPAVLILSHAYWQSKFGGDPGVVGRVLQMNDRPHTVVGVLPAVPHYPAESDVFMPTSACPFRAAAEERIAQNRRVFSALTVFGRLKRGATHEQAAAEVDTVGRRFAQEHPDVYRADSGFVARTADVLEELTRNARPLLLVLLGATGLVLLIACANVANLTLARMLRRDRELAMRAALGAGRTRLLRQLLTESTLVAIVGGALGLVFARATLGMLGAFTSRFTARVDDIAIDTTVLLFTLAVSVVTGVAFGTLPALASRVSPMDALRAGGKGDGDGHVRHRLQRALIVAQVAVSVVLLVGAGLLIASFYRLQRVDPGYRADRVLSAEVFGNFTKYKSADDLQRLYVPLLERLEQSPGVVAAAITNAVPLAGTIPGPQPFRIQGLAADGAERLPAADIRVASPGFFDVLGVRLVRGRVFAASDTRESAPVVVVNQALERSWAGREVVGSRISFDDGETWATVVGVVGNVRQFGLSQNAEGQVYVPLLQDRRGFGGRVILRTAGAPMEAAALVREAVHGVDPNQTIENVRTLEDLREKYLAAPRVTAMLLAAFALLALVVTVAGIAGVIATSVSQRRREFGVRMALGATRERVLAMVLGQGLRLVLAGLLIGGAASLALGRVLRQQLFETPALDPATFATVTAVCVAAGLLACLGPAWRATTVDPIATLRGD